MTTTPTIAPVRLLCLSGGGVRGIYQATFLRRLSTHLPAPLRAQFDVIAGTSTGAIIAAAVACEIDLQLVESFYRNEARQVFSPRFVSGIRRGPRYDHVLLRAALVSVFG